MTLVVTVKSKTPRAGASSLDCRAVNQRGEAIFPAASKSSRRRRRSPAAACAAATTRCMKRAAAIAGCSN